MCGVAQLTLRYSGFYWDTYVVIKMDASVNHAVRSLECLRFMCRLLPIAFQYPTFEIQYTLF